MAHAHVRFCLDSVKKVVPVSYFKEHFDINEYDPSQPYLVFYSPGDKETPQSVLHKCSKIPVFENATQLDKHEGDDVSGFYRATVSHVAASRDAVIEAVEKKRLRAVPLHLVRETSFEKSLRDVPKKSEDKKRHHSSGQKGTKDEQSARLKSKKSNVDKIKQKLIGMTTASKCSNGGTNAVAESTSRDKGKKSMSEKSSTKRGDSNESDQSEKINDAGTERGTTNKRKLSQARESSSSDESADDCYISMDKHKVLLEQLSLQKAEIFKLSNCNEKLRALNADYIGKTAEVENASDQSYQSASVIFSEGVTETQEGGDDAFLEIFKRENVEVASEKLDDLKKIGPGEKLDKPFVKLAATLIWGSKYLREHSTGGRRDPKNPLAAARPVLESERLDAVRDLLIQRVGSEDKKATYGARCSSSRVKRYIGEKIQSLINSECRRRAHTFNVPAATAEAATTTAAAS